MYDTIIIGAGMSGLAAGIRLAHYDRRVCLLERHTTIGGLNSFYRLGGRNYDVGLHAMTNFTPKGARKGPLARMLRQLRFQWDDLGLVQQLGSRIAFPGISLEFNNDFEFLRSQIHEKFPAEKDNFNRLLGAVADYDDFDPATAESSAREVVGRYLRDPLLIEMLFCPLMFYGSARENDIDFAQFCILVRSIYYEGLARPTAGIRSILKQLVRRFRSLGGELRLRAGVNRLHVENGRVEGVVLDDGTELAARNVVSSAGWLETMRMCDDVSEPDESRAGQLSFVETISVLDRPPRDLGFNHTTVFFNNADKFTWQKPDDMVDLRSGTICSPNNFQYATEPEESMIRVTSLANFDRWAALSADEYRLAKLRWYDEISAAAAGFIPDFRGAVIDTDTYTPMTIRRFTGHINGAVYGAARKVYDGTTHLGNLFLCGTDQGFVGIVGALLSGITMANRHLLREA